MNFTWRNSIFWFIEFVSLLINYKSYRKRSVKKKKQKIVHFGRIIEAKLWSFFSVDLLLTRRTSERTFFFWSFDRNVFLRLKILSGKKNNIDDQEDEERSFIDRQNIDFSARVQWGTIFKNVQNSKKKRQNDLSGENQFVRLTSSRQYQLLQSEKKQKRLNPEGIESILNRFHWPMHWSHNNHRIQRHSLR